MRGSIQKAWPDVFYMKSDANYNGMNDVKNDVG